MGAKGDGFPNRIEPPWNCPDLASNLLRQTSSNGERVYLENTGRGRNSKGGFACREFFRKSRASGTRFSRKNEAMQQRRYHGLKSREC
jgi:hypothetical protein